jgi:hypothetical protein
MALALAIKQFDVDSTGKQVYVVGTITASGSYSTGGDTLDLTNQSFIPADALPKQVSIFTQTGQVFNYAWVLGAALNNGKVKIYQAGGTELGAGAYPAGITGDIIAFSAVFPKLQ